MTYLHLISLEDYKKRVEDHMKNELDLMLMALQFDKDDGDELLKWYNSHHYTKSIHELVSSVNVKQRRSNENTGE